MGAVGRGEERAVVGPDNPETVFTWQAPPFKFGPGASEEIGYDLAQLGVREVLLVTDRHLEATGAPATVAKAIEAAGVDVAIYSGTGVEPTDASFADAVDFASTRKWDGFVAVGGGSVIDTAKAINLLTTYPAPVLDYINKPIGKGLAPPGPLKPLVAVPTTAGTGAESTAVCVLDVLDLKVKTGISHSRLRPTMAVIDPTLTLTLPRQVTAAAGMDVLGHALESYTARDHRSFAHRAPHERVAYCGANPVSDLWCERAIKLVGSALRRAASDGSDVAARTDMMLAATFAGMGFGNAGVHIPHACAYPIAGNVRGYRPDGYDADEAMVPHGQAVAITTPAAFRATFAAAPHRHVEAAAWLDADMAAATADDSEKLPTALAALMADIGIPNGLADVGYAEADVPTLVEGALKQTRLLQIAPIEASADTLGEVFKGSMRNW
jgi:alcohol dehydrogenase class IV